jgi:hypothetical protein
MGAARIVNVFLSGLTAAAGCVFRTSGAVSDISAALGPVSAPIIIPAAAVLGDYPPPDLDITALPRRPLHIDRADHLAAFPQDDYPDPPGQFPAVFLHSPEVSAEACASGIVMRPSVRDGGVDQVPGPPILACGQQLDKLNRSGDKFQPLSKDNIHLRFGITRKQLTPGITRPTHNIHK